MFRLAGEKFLDMAKKLEIIGLSLLLFAFGWESLLVELHHKTDILWESKYADFTQNANNTTSSIAFVDMNMTNGQWKSYEQIREDFSMSDEQEDFGQMARIVMYISGSICVILAKGLKKGSL